MPHIHELYDFTITAIVVHDDKVLLINHPRYNKWLSPGGHIELDEDPEQALYREIAEETGLEVTIINSKPPAMEDGIKPMPTPSFVDVHEANPPHKHIGLVYVAIAANANNVLSDEHTDFAWVSKDELDNPKYNLGATLKFYLREALDLARKQQS